MHGQKSTDPLSDLMQWWMGRWRQASPGDWQVLLPKIDYQCPDRNLPIHQLPVLRFLDRLQEQAPAEHQTFIQMLSEQAANLHFNQTYNEDEVGEHFLDHYGWIKFLGPDAYWYSDVLSGGLVLFGDDVAYPEHWMEAEGLYYILSGTSEWYREDLGWQVRSPGEWVLHGSNVKHALRTQGEPLLLMYLLRDGDLMQKSDFD